MTTRDIFIAFIFTLISGGLTLFIHQIYLNRKEERKVKESKLIKFQSEERIIDESIFHSLASGSSIEHMKTVLGAPNKFRRHDYTIFSEKEIETNSYLYLFQNAVLKITSKDNEVIDTLTVICYDNSISLEGFCLPCEFDSYKLGEMKVISELIEVCNHTFIGTRFDSSFALEFYTGAPLYEHYTFFGFSSASKFEYFETKDPKYFIGNVVNGICISNSEEEVYFIYENEIR